MYEHVERYLVGALNEPALEAWRLRVGKGLAAGRALDDIIRRLCEAAEAARAVWDHPAFRPHRDGYLDLSDDELTPDAIDWRDTLRELRDALIVAPASAKRSGAAPEEAR